MSSTISLAPLPCLTHDAETAEDLLEFLIAEGIDLDLSDRAAAAAIIEEWSPLTRRTVRAWVTAAGIAACEGHEYPVSAPSVIADWRLPA